ncbi:hypothetical protein COI68_27170 [Priestia megaterium]|uniref:hypothetical protein n=1 Tax=Priestia megaterium TaxID=1404 RepID=UPI000BF2B74F|nr:hypothetical protein [Priestia megaterium]PFI59467.1 hypothetical protein COI68_27170 [Priestia megaterium]
MIPECIRIIGFTKENRYKIIDHAVKCISDSGGWVTNHTMYSTAIIVINFEIEIQYVKKLLEMLNRNGLNLIEESIDIAKDFPNNVEKVDNVKELIGSVRITFVHDD